MVLGIFLGISERFHDIVEPPLVVRIIGIGDVRMAQRPRLMVVRTTAISTRSSRWTEKQRLIEVVDV
jgi:hypothetical protein